MKQIIPNEKYCKNCQAFKQTHTRSGDCLTWAFGVESKKGFRLVLPCRENV